MNEPSDFPISPARDLASQDEILQIMYWLRGERLSEAVTARELAPWVGLEPGVIAGLLERLEGKGWVESTEDDGGPRYSLTPAGAFEGGRRFADEFADITRPGHGECGDPDCDCQRTGNPADCAHHAGA
ncbi:MAG: winged helix DNA-binding protein [Thermoanaerobaculia bacterium]